MTTDFVVEQILARMDQDTILEVLDLPADLVVEALRDHIVDRLDDFIEYLELES